MKRVIRLSLTFLGVLALYGFAEYRASLWVAANPLPEITDVPIASRTERPEQYRDAAYWSPEFLDEVGQSFQEWTWQGDYLIRADMTGKWITFKDGNRTTVNQPQTAPLTIWLVGNSALIGHELPDEYTIPSQLQKLVGNQAKVVNLGMAGANTAVALSRIKSLDLAEHDIVILMSGSPESTDIFFAADQHRGDKLSDGLCNLLYWHSKSFVIQWACRDTILQTPPGMLDDRLAVYTSNSIEFYKRQLKQITTYLSDKKVRFLNVLQSHPYKDGLTQSQVMDIIHRGGVDIAFHSFYANVPASLVSLNLAETVPPEYFFNSAHVNEHGTALIAQALYDGLNINQ